ncbi:hypothetical protein RclHR1_02930029 [Rhizophagus clarus]|uniref:Uncharacterized protein n=1 Tax=Rhizophagus clarus TaxID=94130 RepID=A0A2Z6R529_9GLOM|nr:hypothetical protein RclHR1_02930029 [Rhizophagus clarus]
MVCEIEGDSGKKKDIIGSSTQGFGIDLVARLPDLKCKLEEVTGLLRRTKLRKYFLDKPNLGNVANLLGRTELENVAGLLGRTGLGNIVRLQT